MKRRIPHLVIAGGSLWFLASLYLPWVSAAPLHRSGDQRGIRGLLDLLSQGGYDRLWRDGWGGFGEAAALVALALLVGALVGLSGRRNVSRAYLATCAVALFSFTALDAADLRAYDVFWSAIEHRSFHFDSGAYVGFASVAVICACVVLAHGEGLVRRVSATEFVAGALTLGVLASILVPLITYRAPHLQRGFTGYEFFSTNHPLAVVAVAVACFGLPLWRRSEPRARVFASASLVLLALGTSAPYWVHSRGSWVELGCALGLLVLALVTGRGDLRIPRPSPLDIGLVVAACGLLASLFLQWQKTCVPQEGCYVLDGWRAAGGLTAGFTALLFLGFRRLSPELALSVALYVIGAGYGIAQFGGFSYGSVVGFAATALLVLYAMTAGLKGIRLDGAWPLRLVPVFACLGLLAIPISSFISIHLMLASPWRLGLLQAGAVVAVCRLLVNWLSGRSTSELLTLPLAVLAIAGLDLAFIGSHAIGWEGWVTVILCVVLFALGWIERRDEWDSFGEIFRVDQVPDPSS